LMLGYMNLEAWKKTQSEGRVWFYSRSKKRLWMKGETSGNTLSIRKAAVDCDRDALLIQVKANGPVCHKGTRSCFTGVPEERFGRRGGAGVPEERFGRRSGEEENND